MFMRRPRVASAVGRMCAWMEGVEARREMAMRRASIVAGLLAELGVVVCVPGDSFSDGEWEIL